MKSQFSTPSASKSTRSTSAGSDGEGLQLHFARNLIQFAAVFVFAAVGSVIGWFLTDDRPDLAALAGGAVGMIVATFISGFVLMFFPPPGAAEDPNSSAKSGDDHQ